MNYATLAFTVYLRKLGLDKNEDFLQESVRRIRQVLMDLEAE